MTFLCRFLLSQNKLCRTKIKKVTGPVGSFIQIIWKRRQTDAILLLYWTTTNPVLPYGSERDTARLYGTWEEGEARTEVMCKLHVVRSVEWGRQEELLTGTLYSRQVDQTRADWCELVSWMNCVCLPCTFLCCNTERKTVHRKTRTAVEGPIRSWIRNGQKA